MKIFGYLLVVLGLIDLITSWTLEYGSPIDSIVGPTIAPFTAYILLGVGYYVIGLGEKDEEGSEEANEE
tara:strand:- start:304 stop:510 length:207 start_codon:yes stop_codon:yes gene_type:complete